MTAPPQQPIHVHLHGGPSNGDAAIVHAAAANLVGQDVRVADPGGNGLLVYGPVRLDEDGTPRADYMTGESTGFTRAVPPAA